MKPSMAALAPARLIVVPTAPEATVAAASASATFGLSRFPFFDVLMFFFTCLPFFLFVFVFGDACRCCPAHRLLETRRAVLPYLQGNKRPAQLLQIPFHQIECNKLKNAPPARHRQVLRLARSR